MLVDSRGAHSWDLYFLASQPHEIINSYLVAQATNKRKIVSATAETHISRAISATAVRSVVPTAFVSGLAVGPHP